MIDDIPSPADLPSSAASRKKEFTRAVQFLRKKKQGEIERLIQHLNDEAFDRIDCRECGNCCKALGPRLNERDTRRLAKASGMGLGPFLRLHTKEDEDGDLVFASMPCPFLADENFCTVYDERPRACAEYPHTSGRQARTKVGQLIHNSSICPAVYLILDELSAMR